MANIPTPVEPIDIMRDTQQAYAVHLTTNVPAAGSYVSAGDFQFPAVTNYEGALVRGRLFLNETNMVGLQLDPAFFKSKGWSAQVIVRGYAVFAMFDDGKVLLYHNKLPKELTLGPLLENLQLTIPMVSQKVPAAVTVQW